MKERPILFTGAMVRALLDGSKSQTRRVAKFVALEPGLNFDFTGLRTEKRPDGSWVLQSRDGSTNLNDRTRRLMCPHGQPGDRLWVRETWACVLRGDCDTIIEYAADKARITYHPRTFNAALACLAPGKYRPNIHMSRVFCRILLEITDIRVERLHGISEKDAVAEGAPGYEEGVDSPPPEDGCEWSYRASYQRLWDSINGKKPNARWDANPWVWVVEFKVVKP
jgi:hypothetical protein